VLRGGEGELQRFVKEGYKKPTLRKSQSFFATKNTQVYLGRPRRSVQFCEFRHVPLKGEQHEYIYSGCGVPDRHSFPLPGFRPGAGSNFTSPSFTSPSNG